MISKLKCKLFFSLLKWFCAKELDQWEMWKLDTKHGRVYVTIARAPLFSTADKHYENLVV